jgi:hypothetical protein
VFGIVSPLVELVITKKQAGNACAHTLVNKSPIQDLNDVLSDHALHAMNAGCVFIDTTCILHALYQLQTFTTKGICQLQKGHSGSCSPAAGLIAMHVGNVAVVGLCFNPPGLVGDFKDPKVRSSKTFPYTASTGCYCLSDTQTDRAYSRIIMQSLEI